MRRLIILAALATIGASPVDEGARLIAARRAAATAEARAERLVADARGQRDAAERAATEEKAMRDRVAAAMAELNAARARVALIDRRLAVQGAELGRRQAPAAKLLAGLQSLARRPTVAAVVQPGSIDELVRLRAVLGAALPAMRQRTQAVRGELATTRRLQASASVAAQALRDGRARLEGERTALAMLEARHRARAQALGRQALSESDRALGLGEQARDLIDRMDTAELGAVTASELARLAGPMARPLAPGSATPATIAGAYRLPVAGRLIEGFGEVSDAGVRARGLTFAVAPGTPVIAPAAGVVSYAGRFRSFGDIVILDHGGGWTTLVSGLGATPLTKGQRVTAGAWLGRGVGEEPRVTVELRRQGRPVDLLALIG